MGSEPRIRSTRVRLNTKCHWLLRYLSSSRATATACYREGLVCCPQTIHTEAAHKHLAQGWKHVLGACLRESTHHRVLFRVQKESESGVFNQHEIKTTCDDSQKIIMAVFSKFQSPKIWKSSKMLENIKKKLEVRAKTFGTVASNVFFFFLPSRAAQGPINWIHSALLKTYSLSHRQQA